MTISLQKDTQLLFKSIEAFVQNSKHSKLSQFCSGELKAKAASH